MQCCRIFSFMQSKVIPWGCFCVCVVTVRVCFGDTQVGVQVRVCVWAEFMCLCRGCVLKAFSHSRGCRTAQSECIFTDGVWMNINTTLYHSNSTRCWSWCACMRSTDNKLRPDNTLWIYWVLKKCVGLNSKINLLWVNKHNYYLSRKMNCIYSMNRYVCVCVCAVCKHIACIVDVGLWMRAALGSVNIDLVPLQYRKSSHTPGKTRGESRLYMVDIWTHERDFW